MVEMLQSQNAATRFRILVEIVTNQPNIQQKYIARKLEITPQAVSDYVKQLLSDELLVSEGRSRYRLSIKGIDWVIKQARAAKEYLGLVERVIGNIRVSAAVAQEKLLEGQRVGLVMRGGLLFATMDKNTRAQGTVESNAEPGDDVGISNIQGIIELKPGEVTIAELPAVNRGGSNMADLDKLNQEVSRRSPIIAIGIESITALKRIDTEPDYIYAAKEVAIDAARLGLSPLVVCVDEETPFFIKRLTEAGIEHRLINLKRS